MKLATQWNSVVVILWSKSIPTTLVVKVHWNPTAHTVGLERNSDIDRIWRRVWNLLRMWWIRDHEHRPWTTVWSEWCPFPSSPLDIPNTHTNSTATHPSLFLIHLIKVYIFPCLSSFSKDGQYQPCWLGACDVEVLLARPRQHPDNHWCMSPCLFIADIEINTWPTLTG